MMSREIFSITSETHDDSTWWEKERNSRSEISGMKKVKIDAADIQQKEKP